MVPVHGFELIEENKKKNYNEVKRILDCAEVPVSVRGRRHYIDGNSFWSEEIRSLEGFTNL